MLIRGAEFDRVKDDMGAALTILADGQGGPWVGDAELFDGGRNLGCEWHHEIVIVGNGAECAVLRQRDDVSVTDDRRAAIAMQLAEDEPELDLNARLDGGLLDLEPGRARTVHLHGLLVDGDGDDMGCRLKRLAVHGSPSPRMGGDGWPGANRAPRTVLQREVGVNRRKWDLFHPSQVLPEGVD